MRYSGDLIIGLGSELSEKGFGERNIFIYKKNRRDFLNYFYQRNLKVVHVYIAIFIDWLVVSNIFYFHPYLGKIPILTNIFQRG